MSPMPIDSIAYTIRSKSPTLFNLIETALSGLTRLRYSRRRKRAIAAAEVSGSVRGRFGTIRSLVDKDLTTLHAFLSGIPAQYFSYFHPHSFSMDGLHKVLSSTRISCYGLFVDADLVAYCLIKLFPTRQAYCGLIVHPEYAGWGIGKFLWRYLIWQSYLLGALPAATVHMDNVASLRSLQAVEPQTGTHKLRNGYLRLTIPIRTENRERPELRL